MGKKDEEILGVWAELFVGHAYAVREVEHRIAGKSPLSVAEYDVMLCIQRSPGARIRYAALAAATVYTKSGITRIMTRLEREGLVLREQCPEDKRGAFAVLSPKGVKALAESWKQYSAAIIEVLGPIYSEREAGVLRELLGRIVERFSAPVVIGVGKASKRD